jgi:LPXTG-site transpeptidase (sortase) family protein
MFLSMQTLTPSRNSQNRPPLSVFLATSMVMFVLSLSAADSIGMVPYYIDGTAPAADSQVALSSLPMLGDDASAPDATPTHAAQKRGPLPKNISASAIDLDLAVQNPATTDVDALDLLLQNGPARYASSARLGEQGNVVIFAHSSHLPIVHNQMFRAFNRVPELTSGDIISLTGDDGAVYNYSVTSVERADTKDATLDLGTDQGARLTLVTCDTLTGKSARFVVSAVLVE